MIEVILSIIGLILAFFGYKVYTKHSANEGQRELDKKVAKIDQKIEDIQSDQQREDKETQEKINAIDKEKSSSLSGDSLAEWFRRRK